MGGVALLGAAALEGAARPAAAPAHPPVALYVHVPFCSSHCPYCDFVVVAGRAARGPASRVAAFLGALRAELALRADALDRRFGERAPLASVYLGGGTPSLLPAGAIAGLLELIGDGFGLAAGAEVTLEVNPGRDERGDAAAQRAAGVTRLSIGAQSMDPGELRTLGRRHAPGDVEATVRAAREAGIGSVSLDLLHDVPGQTLASWARTLEAALDLAPDHLSLYALTLDDPDAEGLTGVRGDHLPLRPGARRWRTSARAAQDDDRAAAMYELADDALAAAGFDWYEISNWSRPGHRSRHNLAYWRSEPFEAVGPGAHAFDGATRRWNAARLDGYVAALAPEDGTPPRLPPGGSEASEAGGGPERTLLALRTSDGVPVAALDDGETGSALAWGIATGLLDRTADERLVLTRRGRLLSNELFARLV